MLAFAVFLDIAPVVNDIAFVWHWTIFDIHATYTFKIVLLHGALHWIICHCAYLADVCETSEATSHSEDHDDEQDKSSASYKSFPLAASCVGGLDLQQSTVDRYAWLLVAGTETE